LLVEFSSIAIKIKEPIIGTSRRDVIMDCIYYMFSFSPGPPHAPLAAEQGAGINKGGYILPLFYSIYPYCILFF
jgi:hypothetical protein